MKNEQRVPLLSLSKRDSAREPSTPRLKTALRGFSGATVLLGVLLGAQQIHAANQTWTNAPVDNTWNNVNNWVGKAAPGDVNIVTANTVNNDVATFNSPIFNGIGGAANPILPDDGTLAGGRSRRIGGITFDTTNCGPYVIWSPSAVQITDGSTIPSTGVLYVSHTNAIRINDSVTNSQAVIIPLYVNLPASTAGSYNLINNSTNPGVTLTINSITHAGANTRATTFILDGTSTANNVVTNLSEGPGNATGGFTKQGPGTWIIAGPGTFPAASPLNINQGTLAVLDPTAFGVATNAVVTNATLRIDGVALSTANISLRNGGTILGRTNASVNGVIVSAISGNTNSTLATASPSDILAVGSVNVLSGGAVDTILHVTGPGTIFVAQPATYAGKWSVDSGTNQIQSQGSLGTGPNLNINAGAVFDTSPFGSGTYTLDTKALSANGTGTAVGSTAATISADANGTVDLASRPITLTFTPTAFSGDSGHPALYCSRGTLAFHGNSITVNNASGTPLGVGTYQLVRQASGNISSSGAFVALVTGSGLAAGTIAEITASGGSLNMVVTTYTPKSLTWIGNDPTTPATWDRQVSANWLAGGNPSTFNLYDGVKFDSTGAAAPTVTIAGVMQPSSLVVDTTGNDYTFTGLGQVAGGTSLIKTGPGNLILQTANTYSGGTAISNGVIKLGIDEGVGSTGAAGQNDVTIVSPGVFDLNNFSNTVNGLNGNGTVDITGGGISTLNIGYNGNSGVFTGVIKNTSGTLGIDKVGTGIETLTSSNTYLGPTIIDLGTLRVTNTYALGAGNSPVTNNAGTLDMQTSLIITNLGGAGGTIINSSATTNMLTIQTNSTYGGVIGGKITVYVAAGTLQLNGVNTYSNGTIVAAGAGLSIGGGAANPGPGTVIASNNVTIRQANAGVSSSGFSPPVNTVDGATVTFTSGNTANTWNSLFTGSASATNLFSGGAMSIGGTMTFSNFLGTVIFTNGGIRWFTANGGGDSTTWGLVGTGASFTRDPDIIHFGALFGDGGAAGTGGGITQPTTAPGTYWIGGKNNDSKYDGAISGSNNIVKIGNGTLTLDGAATSVLFTDNAAITNYTLTNLLTYSGFTTVSNGALKVTSPSDLTSSSPIMVASGALLDATSMGSVSNFTDNLGNPNAVLTTNGEFNIVNQTPFGVAQVVGGSGVIKASRVINNGTINPGFAGVAGTLTVSNNLVVNSGATNYFDLSDSPSGPPSDLLSVNGNITLSGSSYIGIGAVRGTLGTGVYPIIRYTGVLSNESGVVPTGPIPNFVVGGDIANITRATVGGVSNTPGEIDLFISSINSSNLTWSGFDTTNVWDVVNHFNFTNSIAAQVLQFYQLDNVAFDDTGSNNVVLSGGVAPNLITVNNSATNYNFGGNGSIIGDTALIKSGTSFLLLTNSTGNTFSGGTVINGGIVKAGLESGGNQNDLALGVGPVTINAGGQLRFGGNSGGVVNHFVTNAIVLNGGTLQAQDGVQHMTNSTVTITNGGGSLTTIFSTKNLVLDSPLVGSGNVTIASGTNIAAGQVVINNSNNTFSGSATIATNGNLAFVGLGNLTNAVTIDVQKGGVLDITGRSNSTWSVASGQTLKGEGIIRGKTNSFLAGSTVSPGIAGAIGTLTVTNVNATNFSVINFSGTLNMDINRASAVNSDRIQNSNGTNNFGGTLNVNNLGAALQAGDSFQLFTGTNFGAFTTINYPVLTGNLAWNNTLNLNGRITVVSQATAPTVPPAITNFSLSFGTNIIINGTNGQAGATYYIITATNIGSPLNQWKTIATNVAAGDAFSFGGTNAVNPVLGKQFYILSSTNYNP
jgi:fibronectin-binding autotransporter adhesin